MRARPGAQGLCPARRARLNPTADRTAVQIFINIDVDGMERAQAFYVVATWTSSWTISTRPCNQHAALLLPRHRVGQRAACSRSGSHDKAPAQGGRSLTVVPAPGFVASIHGRR
jgi:hypothetical protein